MNLRNNPISMGLSMEQIHNNCSPQFQLGVSEANETSCD